MHFPNQVSGLNDPYYLQSFLAVNPELQVLIPQNGEHIGEYIPNIYEVEERAQLQREAEDTQAVYNGILGNVNFLCFNPLSRSWKRGSIANSCASLPVVYILGMIGYALSLPMRVVILALNLLKLVGTFFLTMFKCQWRDFGSRMKFSGLVFLGSLGETVSGAIGVVCPPIAYKFDEWIQSNKTIHADYATKHWSHWSFEIEGRVVEAGGTGIGGVGLQDTIGNEQRMELKKERVQGDLQYFEQAKEELAEYLEEEIIAGMDPDLLYNTMALGFLNALMSGKALTTFRDEALEKCDGIQKNIKESSLNEKLDKFDALHSASVKGQSIAEKLASAPLIGRFFKKGNNGNKIKSADVIRAIKYEIILDMVQQDNDGDPEGYLKGGKKTYDQLADQLKSLENFLVEVETKNVNKIEKKQISLRAAIHEMYQTVNLFAHEICDTDREMFNVILKEVFQAK